MMNPNKIDDILKSKEFRDVKEKLGSFFELSEQETLVYVTLLTNTELTATEVSKTSGIRRP